MFSPDGKSIAYSRVAGENCEFAVTAASGGGYRALSAFPAPATLWQWFPEGTALLVTDAADPPGIWRVPLEGERQRLGQGEHPRLSPSGRRLAFVLSGELHVVTLDGGPVIRAPAGAGWRLGDWLDDDTILALPADGSLTAIGLAAPGTHKVLVPHTIMANNFVAATVSTARRAIALTSDDVQFADPDSRTSVWVFDREGNRIGDPFSDASDPRWTTNGDLFFSRRRQVMRSEDLRKARGLAKGETWDVSPDGSVLVVSRQEADDSSGLADPSAPRKLYRIPIVEKKAGPARPLLD